MKSSERAAKRSIGREREREGEERGREGERDIYIYIYRGVEEDERGRYVMRRHLYLTPLSTVSPSLKVVICFLLNERHISVEVSSKEARFHPLFLLHRNLRDIFISRLTYAG